MPYRKCLCICFQSLVAHIDLLELHLNALKENATESEQFISESSKAITSHSVLSLWQRWTRLRRVARAQERALEDTAREWRNFTEKVRDKTGYLLLLLCMISCVCVKIMHVYQGHSIKLPVFSDKAV